MNYANDTIATATTPASLTDAGEAFPRLPDHVVVEHILRSEYFDDPADLARLPAVSRAMRDTVAATGLRFEELDEKRAVMLGCLSALQRRHRQGRLSRQESLCQAAARGGNLEELKVLRADGWPWGVMTCAYATLGGHLEVLQWARANGCPWDGWTCASAAMGGHLELLQWLRANGCPWDENTCAMAAGRGHLEVLQWARAKGCPWNWVACAGAAFSGHLEVLQWLRAQTAALNNDTRTRAASRRVQKQTTQKDTKRFIEIPSYADSTCSFSSRKFFAGRLRHGIVKRVVRAVPVSV